MGQLAGPLIALDLRMKKLLWLAAAVSAVVAAGIATAAIINSRHRQLRGQPLALAGGWGFIPPEDILEAELVVEIIPLDVMSGPLPVDAATQEMLQELADTSMFLK